MAAWRLSILRVARSTTTTSVRPPIAPTARGEYTYTTEAVDEEVTVPAGTFRCVRIRRNTSIHFDYDFPGKTADAFYNVQKAWLCPGVGVVRADNYRVDGDQEIFVSQIMLESYFDPEA